MKKLLLIITIAISSITQAQKGAQEASLDISDAILMKSLEFSYEYYILDQTSVGISTLINFAKEEPKILYKEKTMITPYFRHYLTNGEMFNYFGEIFFGINSGYKESKPGTDIAIGASVGLKYLSEGGILVSALGGIGRNMLGKGYVVVPRFGLSVGYRF